MSRLFFSTCLKASHFSKDRDERFRKNDVTRTIHSVLLFGSNAIKS